MPPLKLTPKIKAQPKNDMDKETESDNYKADRPPLPRRPTMAPPPSLDLPGWNLCGWTSPLPGHGLVEALPLPQTGLQSSPDVDLGLDFLKRLHFLFSLQGWTSPCLDKSRTYLAGTCVDGLVLVVVDVARLVGELAIGLSGSGRELDVDVDGSCGSDVARCCFVAGSTTMSSVTFVCCPKSCVDRLFSDDCS